MKNKELLDYIEQQLQQGINKEDIKNLLLPQGWQEQDIAEAFQAIEEPTAKLPKKGKWKLVVLIVSIIAILVGFFILFFPKINGSSYKDIPKIDDTDLSLKVVIIPKKDNAYYDLIKLKYIIYNPDWRSKDVLGLVSGKVWNDKLAEDIISKNTKTFEYFAKAANKPEFQDPIFANPANDTSGTTLIPVNTWRNVARLSAIHALYLSKHGKEKSAMDEVLNSVKIGQKMQESQYDLIGYLIATAMKEIGLSTAQKILLSSSSLSSDELKSYTKELNQFYKNDSGLVSVFKNRYKIISADIERTFELDGPLYKSVINIISDEKDGATSDNVKKTIKNPFYFQPNKTKLLFANSMRSQIKMVYGPCNKISSIKIPEFTPDLYAKFSKSENAVGNIIYSVVSFDITNIITKKCEDSLLVGVAQTMFAIKAFHKVTGRYPTILEELVPKYIPSIPQDPFDGKMLKYLPKKGVLYSVGKDLKDEGASSGDNWRAMPDPTFKIFSNS